MNAKPPRSPARRILSADEQELWVHVTASVKKLKRVVKKPALITPAAIVKQAKAPPGKQPKKIRLPAAIAQPQPLPPKPPVRPLVPLEPKTKRRLGRGQIEVGARIDLHGMRQHEAHDALVRFIVLAHQSDMRIVLVITGKGGTARARDFDGQHEVGILRRMVPHWLAGPGLRNMVLGYELASARHGGEGALYVRLRRNS